MKPGGRNISPENENGVDKILTRATLTHKQQINDDRFYSRTAFLLPTNQKKRMDYTKDNNEVKTDKTGCLVFLVVAVVLVAICMIFGL
jgi:hypothetical protein